MGRRAWFNWPTAVISGPGSGIGPTAVVLKQERLTYGMLASQIWSFAGDSGRAELSDIPPAVPAYTFPAQRRSR
jgi:hypothetical protein